MEKLSTLCVGILIFICLQSYAQETLLEPQPSTAFEDSLIDIGIALHDKGEFDKAIKIYKDVLDINPANMVALCELTGSFFALKDYESAISYSKTGLKYKSQYQALFYLNIGNCLDILGKKQEAISAYYKGIQLQPGVSLLHFNLALLYYQNNQLDSARFYCQRALQLDHSHANSNMLLANIYRDMNKTIPRIFALSRFIILEPVFERRKIALDELQKVLVKSVVFDSTNLKKISVNVSPDSDQVDGNMAPLELSLAMLQVAQHLEENNTKTDLQRTADVFKNFFQILLELYESNNSISNGFCWDYYIPYYIDMQRNDLTETFVYLIFRTLKSEEIEKWIDLNMDKIKEFYRWDKKYQW